jgi:copper chaperone
VKCSPSAHTPYGYRYTEHVPVTEVVYTVPGMSCEHCEHAVRSELGEVAGVESVDVDLETNLVTVRGQNLDDAALRASIEEAGYEAA